MTTKLTKAQREHLAEHLRNLVVYESEEATTRLSEAERVEHSPGGDAVSECSRRYAERHHFEAESFAACLALVMEAEVTE